MEDFNRELGKHKVLNKVAITLNVEDIGSSEVQELIDDMITVMAANHGVGLAANQIDSPLSICVIIGKRFPTILINPEITWLSPKTVVSYEGCLSIPGKRVDVERNKQITVTALNRYGKPVKFKKVGGRFAIVLQHEIDHLNGISITDKVYNKEKGKEDVQADNF